MGCTWAAAPGAAAGRAIGATVTLRAAPVSEPLVRASARACAAAADEDERAFWKRTIEKGDQRDRDLEHALDLLNRHGALEATRQDALAWSAKAKAAMQALPEHPVRQMLIELADYVVARVS